MFDERESNFQFSVKGHVKGGRTLRGRARSPDEWEPPSTKRKRRISDDEDDKSSTDDEQSATKTKRARKMEASPEVSENEID